MNEQRTKKGWIKFPERIWEALGDGTWASRPVTRADLIDRQALVESSNTYERMEIE